MAHNKSLHLIEGRIGEFRKISAFFKFLIISVSPVKLGPSAGETKR